MQLTVGINTSVRSSGHEWNIDTRLADCVAEKNNKQTSWSLGHSVREKDRE